MSVDHHPAAHRVRRRELADDQAVAGQRNERCLEPELRVAGTAQGDDSGRRLTRAVVDVDPCASLERLKAFGLEPPPDDQFDKDEQQLLAQLRHAGKAERVGPFTFHPDALAGVRERVVAIMRDEGSITLARLRDELHTSRRYAQALLEHLDGTKVTRRVGDEHKLRAR